MKPHDLPNVEPLVAALLERAPRMSFMQLCRLLEVRAPDRPGFGTRDTPEHEPVRFGAWPRVGFPAGEVARVEYDSTFDDDGRPPAPPTVRTTFMGLYGVDAAMPPHLIDDIVVREEGHEAVEAFLDRFNHRFVTVLYRVWKKYRYPESFRPAGRDAHSRNLLCLVGFGWGGKPERAGLPDSRMLALLGLLGMKTRTPEGLAGVIALAVPGVDVRVDEFFPAVTSVGQPRTLTSRPAAAEQGTEKLRGLGGGYVLGRRLAYRSRAVRVTLRPDNARDAHDLLPGAWLHRELIAFVQLYVGVKADVHLRMEVSSRLAPLPTIGTAPAEPAPRLGWTTVLPAENERMITIALGVREAFPAPPANPYLSPQRAESRNR
ncbi:type VI secretion system baseplate subunit TssG [Paraburkholderia sp. MMS20-SJTR3]|uniref:Type VI secretion system baseplate subunit TssG n=1 Tax=Paraburkholderia sejongensis TaxID=2886946 RepID=A0ABS8JRG1_9BURK|nr:type VI secretion system baseplate subunit TssG [Paraburkholderia sp. MMS20-SJTR3]MCC8392462.1 type VI secretion system baseplate subunit TssG [Paraburkholderia sp. MMS20-SJTR3]